MKASNLLNETTKINEIKLNIGLLENSLEKFMEMDLSNDNTRSEMRIVLNKITKLEDKLSKFLLTIKL
tara:strand:- start:1779 stop:1982 length:204 start_codon:yes stop_codon:yes gene_type:complete